MSAASRRSRCGSRTAGNSAVDLRRCHLSEGMAKAAKETNPQMEVIHKQTLEEAIDSLQQCLKQGDTILVKASHFMHFEKIVEVLTKQE